MRKSSKGKGNSQEQRDWKGLLSIRLEMGYYLRKKLNNFEPQCFSPYQFPLELTSANHLSISY